MIKLFVLTKFDFLIKVEFLPQITQFDKSINLFCLVFLTHEFL